MIVAFSEIVNTQKGKNPPVKSKMKLDGYIPYIDIKAFEQGIFDTYTDGNKCLLCDDGDILLVWDGARAGLVGTAYKGAVGSTLVKIDVPLVEKKYVLYFLNYFSRELNAKPKGTGIPHINPTVFNSLPFPLSPISEQQRIIAKIDSLFSELDNGIKLLKTIKTQLPVYRQIVLKWAFEGKLTNNDWKIGVLEDIVSEFKIGPFGTLLHKADYIENGIPIVNPKHLNNQKIIYDPHTTISKQKAKELSSYKLQENDIILARRGEMGRTAPVTEKEIGWLCGTGSMIVRLKAGNLNGLYSLFLSSGRVRKYLTENCKGTTMSNLNEAIVKKIPIPICSKSEQLAIVSAIESRLSVCDKLEQTVDQALALSASLRQSILKKAFEGRLVTQDPNDEPAEKLLERIRLEKASKGRFLKKATGRGV